MKLERIALVSTLALALGAGACSRERQQAAQPAQTQLTSEQIRAQEEAAREEQRRQEQAPPAERKPMSAEERAKLESEQMTKRTEAQTEHREEAAERQKEATEAQASLEHERQEAEAKGKERLGKLDAKATEARGKSGKLTAAKKSQFDTDWRNYTVHRNEVEARLRALSTAPHSGMKAAKAELDRALDRLESTVDKLDRDL